MIGASILRLAAGNSAAQLLQLASLPLLTHFFEPYAFGVYTVFVGLAAIISVFAGLRYDAALALPRRAAGALALAALVLALSMVVAVIVGVATWIIAPRIPAESTSAAAWFCGLGLALG